MSNINRESPLFFHEQNYVKELSIEEVCQITNGTIPEGAVYDLSSIKINGIAPLDEAGPGDLSFLHASAPREMRKLRAIASQSKSGAVLVSKVQNEMPGLQIVVDHPLIAIIKVAKFLYKKSTPRVGIHSSAVVDPSAKVHPTAKIGALAVIGAYVEIGENTVIHPHVVLYDNVIIGANCVLHSGAVIRENVVIHDDCLVQNGAVVGSDGFGYLPIPKVGLERIPHVGTVILENGVDLGANTTVDRATFGKTRIGAGSKIDNLVMIGHNVQIGSGSILCGQVGIAGSSRIGKGVVLAGQVGIADHISVADGVRVAAKSGIGSNLESAGDYAGIPARSANSWKKEQAILGKLAERSRSHKGDEP